MMEKFLIFFGSYLNEASALSAGDLSLLVFADGAAYAVELNLRKELASGLLFKKRDGYRTPHADIMDVNIIQNLRQEMVARICISGGSVPSFDWNQQRPPPRRSYFELTLSSTVCLNIFVNA